MPDLVPDVPAISSTVGTKDRSLGVEEEAAGSHDRPRCARDLAVAGSALQLVH